MSSLFDELVQGVGNAVTDIREKVVEEAYFGRVVTDNQQPSALPDAPAAVSPDAAPPSAWESLVQQAQLAPQQQERTAPEPEPEIDR